MWLHGIARFNMEFLAQVSFFYTHFSAWMETTLSGGGSGNEINKRTCEI